VHSIKKEACRKPSRGRALPWYTCAVCMEFRLRVACTPSVGHASRDGTCVHVCRACVGICCSRDLSTFAGWACFGYRPRAEAAMHKTDKNGTCPLAHGPIPIAHRLCRLCTRQGNWTSKGLTARPIHQPENTISGAVLAVMRAVTIQWKVPCVCARLWPSRVRSCSSSTSLPLSLHPSHVLTSTSLPLSLYPSHLPLSLYPSHGHRGITSHVHLTSSIPLPRAPSLVSLIHLPACTRN
jgi:hypothetical protein